MFCHLLIIGDDMCLYKCLLKKLVSFQNCSKTPQEASIANNPPLTYQWCTSNMRLLTLPSGFRINIGRVLIFGSQILGLRSRHWNLWETKTLQLWFPNEKRDIFRSARVSWNFCINPSVRKKNLDHLYTGIYASWIIRGLIKPTWWPPRDPLDAPLEPWRPLWREATKKMVTFRKIS